jgi:predicted ABC-class ATPase
MGGSGDYLDVADRVIAMDDYLPKDVTQRAKEVSLRHRASRRDEGGPTFGEITKRVPNASSFDPSRGKREVRIDAKGREKILFGTLEVDLSSLSQLVETGQTRAVGNIIHRYASEYAPGGFPLAEGLGRVFSDIEREGLDILLPYKVGDLACPRIFEAVGAVNRMRTLRVV